MTTNQPWPTSQPTSQHTTNQTNQSTNQPTNQPTNENKMKFRCRKLFQTVSNTLDSDWQLRWSIGSLPMPSARDIERSHATWIKRQGSAFY